MKYSVPWLAFLAITLTVMGGCRDGRFARVQRIDSMAQTIGGPAAAGNEGDFLLENDRIRLIIHGRAGKTVSTVAFGGTVIDADIQRPQTEFRAGRGLDQFFELGPMVNLLVPQPDPDNKSAFKIVRPEANDEGGAILRVEGYGGNIIEAIGLIGLILPDLPLDKLYLQTDYELRPGEPFIRITTTAFPAGNTDADGILKMEGFEGTRSLLSVLLGELEPKCETDADCSDPSHTCVVAFALGGMKTCRGPDSEGAPGAFGAWLALMGGKLKTFVPGAGYDPWLSLKSAIALDKDIFSNPSPFSYMAGVGDRISYAIFGSDGDLLVPLSSSNFTVAISNSFHCKVSEPNCMEKRGLQMSAFMAIGEGDVASAVDYFYAHSKIPTGSVKGVVVEQRTGQPVTKADVFAVADPWPELTDDEVRGKSYAQIVNANRKKTKSEARPLGDAGIITHFRTDVGIDALIDGNFGGKIPIHNGRKRVFLVAKKGHTVSEPHPIRINEDTTSAAVVVLPEAGWLNYVVHDINGKPMPAKITLGQCLPDCALDADCASSGKVCDVNARRCVPENGCSSNSDCDPDEICEQGECVCSVVGAMPREMGGHWLVDGTVTAEYVDASSDTLAMPPGNYEIIFSRGLEYNIERQFVTIRPSQTTAVAAQLTRVVDTAGFVSADFHVHSGNSPDSGLSLEKRLLSYIGEGVEFLSASDHDVFTDYKPAVNRLDYGRYIKTQTGVETSPLMLSHFLGFPVKFDETKSENIPEEAAFDWYFRPPFEVISDIRGAGALEPRMNWLPRCEEDEDCEIQCHNEARLGCKCVDAGDDGKRCVPACDSAKPVCPKAYPKPSNDDEDSDDGDEKPELTCDGCPTSMVCQEKGHCEPRAHAIVVLPHVYDYFNYYSLDSFDLSVSPGLFTLADPAFSMENFTSTYTGFEIANGKSMDFIRRPTVGEVRDYNNAHEKIAAEFRSGAITMEEYAQRHVVLGRATITQILERTPKEQNAFLNAKKGVDCGCLSGELDNGCDALEDEAHLPCKDNLYRGIMDDWFRMLNRGIVRTAQFNSDSHDLYHIEAGIPRNYMVSSTDQPLQIDVAEINAAVEKGASTATYGPFIRFTVNGQNIGSTVAAKADESVTVKISVQSPLWFDVDRVELYRNGAVVRVWESCDRTPESGDCIALPNNTVENLSVEFEETPGVDAWYVVTAAGIRGKDLAPIYSSLPVARLGLTESLESLFEVIPIGAIAGGGSKAPSVHPTIPYGMTNPIWVDIDGDGITPAEGDPPDWINR